MIVRSYSGRTVAEALEKVRNDLGANALIIETRSCKLPGLLGKHTGYEVVAAGDANGEEMPQAASEPSAVASQTFRTLERSQPEARRPASLPINMDSYRHSQAKQLAAAIPEQAVEDPMQRGDLSLERKYSPAAGAPASGHGKPTTLPPPRSC